MYGRGKPRNCTRKCNVPVQFCMAHPLRDVTLLSPASPVFIVAVRLVRSPSQLSFVPFRPLRAPGMYPVNAYSIEPFGQIRDDFA